jgi:hypothetical protein
MDRKTEISQDIWNIMREVYGISALAGKSEKQALFLDKVVEYIDTNLSTRRKKQDDKEKKECSKQQST